MFGIANDDGQLEPWVTDALRRDQQTIVAVESYLEEGDLIACSVVLSEAFDVEAVEAQLVDQSLVAFATDSFRESSVEMQSDRFSVAVDDSVLTVLVGGCVAIDIGVLACAAFQDVVSRAAFQRVVSCAALEGVCAAVAFQSVVARAALKDIVAGVA